MPPSLEVEVQASSLPVVELLNPHLPRSLVNSPPHSHDPIGLVDVNNMGAIHMYTSDYHIYIV